eukprot:COSAG06_NODE_23240_length_698_cov_1.667780_1_plen_52_part_10
MSLHDAARVGDTAAIARLLREGADVNAVTSVDNTPLHHAAYYGHAEAVEALA